MLKLVFLGVCAIVAWLFTACLVAAQTAAFILPVVALYLWL